MELDKNSSLYDCLVVEVSSYQMELPGCFKPRVGVILNLTPDHLGRHGTMENYALGRLEVRRMVFWVPLGRVNHLNQELLCLLLLVLSLPLFRIHLHHYRPFLIGCKKLVLIPAGM
eukprot:tig00021357_g20744.t1